MMEFVLGVLTGIGLTVGIYLGLSYLAQMDPWEDPLTKGPPKRSSGR